MLKLIRLEWKKNNIIAYIRGAVILSACLSLFIFAFAFLGIAEDPDGSLDIAEEMNSISLIIEGFCSISYLVFTSVMLASFIVSAYSNKTMNLMFSYPIRRHKILASQMMAVWIFCFAASVLTKLLMYFCILGGGYFLESAVPVDFNMGNPLFYIQLAAKSFVTVSMSFIALFVGMAMKSSKASIVTSFFLVLLTQATIGDFSLAGNMLFPAVLTIISFVSAGLSLCNIETRDLV